MFLKSFLGGFGSYLLGLSKKTYELAGVDTVGNSVESYKEPGIGWMVGFLFVVCFVGLFVLIPLRKVCIYEFPFFVLFLNLVCSTKFQYL